MKREIIQIKQKEKRENRLVAKKEKKGKGREAEKRKLKIAGSKKTEGEGRDVNEK